MLDLKSKLLAAGLITKEQSDNADREKEEQKKARAQKRREPPPASRARPPVRPRPQPRPQPKPRPQPRYDNFEEKQRDKQMNTLRSVPKNEQYDIVRRWVDRNRLDKHTGVLPENTERFFFQKADSTISWLTLETSVHAQVTDGKAAIMAFMSNHGLAHCVIQRDIAEDVALVFPFWLRVLKDHPAAGQIEEKKPDTRNQETPVASHASIELEVSESLSGLESKP